MYRGAQFLTNLSRFLHIGRNWVQGTSVAEVLQHLAPDEEGNHRRGDDEEHSKSENVRAAARAIRTFAPLVLELNVEQPEQLFWRRRNGFGLFRGVHFKKQSMFGSAPTEKAYFAPFAAFLGFNLLNELVKKVFGGWAGPWWQTDPQMWVFPLQTVVCGYLLFRWWRLYEFKFPDAKALAIGAGAGVLVLLIWVAPQAWLGFAPRNKGFDLNYFGTSGPRYLATVGFRFFRLAVVVPLLEEIFWRGYLMRVLIAEPFTSVKIGAFTWLSFLVVTAGFCLEHQMIDWPAALLAGVIYNLVAIRTQNLGACVLAHGVTNFILGIFAMRTGQWGFL
jgi:CAAX prenyl protease-like protein